MRSVYLLLLLTFAFTACTNYGKKVSIDGSKGEVYYKGDAVSKKDAEKLGKYLKNDVPYFDNERRKSIQLMKAKDGGYDIRFAVDKKKLEQTPEAIESFEQIGAALSIDLYNNEPVNILLTDTRFKDFKTIPFNKETVRKLMEKLKSAAEQNEPAEEPVGTGN
ncbi:MAG: hypothetical protein HZB42_02250 [Sphingobacteriales bacterium]|nr:hypothetical protein [Sphingobacteriales bacterium]